MLPIRFGITNITNTIRVADIRVNVQDEYRHLVYTGKPLSHQVPISFVGIPETTTNNIQIKDLYEIPGGFSIRENSYLTRFIQFFEDKVFDLVSKYALITDEVLDSATGNPVPLFYKHKLSNGFLSSPEILDQDLNQVPIESFKIVVSDSEIAVYHNLTPDIDAASGRIRVYYIRYTTAAGLPVFSLLESKPVFKEATLFDWPVPHKKLYTVRKVGSAFRYRILFEGPGPFYVKLNHDSQIKLKKPVLARGTEPWFLRITNGELMATIDSHWERYSIPEYHFQTFTPTEPIQYSGTQECKVLSNHIALSPFENILFDEDHRIELLVTDNELVPRLGYSSGPSEPRRFWIDRFGKWKAQGSIIKFPLSSFSDSNISVNTESGVIHFPLELAPTDRVFIRAYREVRDFTYMSLNLNPLHNRSLLTGRAVIYILPNSELDESQIAIHHIILDPDDAIIEWSDPRLEDGNGDLINDLVADEETGYSKFQNMFPKTIIIGIVTINRQASVNDIAFIDVRQSGGKLTKKIEDSLGEFLDDYPELEWLTENSISGRSIPLLGSFLLKLPFSLLEEAGGQFTREDVEKIATRHMSLGGFPIIEYYAETPVIERVFYSSLLHLIEVAWTSVPQADSYRIYISNDRTKGYAYIETIGVEDSLLPNTLVKGIGITGAGFPDITFTPADKIFVYVAPVKNGQEWPASEIAMLDTTKYSNVLEMLALGEIKSTPTLECELIAELREEE